MKSKRNKTIDITVEEGKEYLERCIDASKIKSELGWEREYKFDDAIKATVEWYVKNDKWLSEIESGEYLRFMRSHYGE